MSRRHGLQPEPRSSGLCNGCLSLPWACVRRGPRTLHASLEAPATRQSGSISNTAPCRSIRRRMICAAAMDLGLAPFARIPEREYGVIGRLLDGGVLGIIAPRVESVEEARDIVAACRFPPLGHRSAVAPWPMWGSNDAGGEATRTLNQATVVKILLESPRASRARGHRRASRRGYRRDRHERPDRGAGDGRPVSPPGGAQGSRNRDCGMPAARKPLAIGGIGDVAYAAELIRVGAAPFMFTGIDTDLLLAAARDRVSQALASLKSCVTSHLMFRH